MKVKFVPQNVEFEIKPGQSVLHVAQDHNIYIKSVCKGVPSCAECRVRVIDGEHNVLPPGSEELALIGTGHFIDRRRLSCQLKCYGDITIDMQEQLDKESGVISGQKKKKLAIKDDRIEDAPAIRADDPPSDGSPEGEPGVVSEEQKPRPRSENRGSSARVNPREENRGAGREGPRAPRGPRPPAENRPPNPVVIGGPAGAAPGDPSDGARATGGGARKRRRRGGRGRGEGGGNGGGGGAPGGQKP